MCACNPSIGEIDVRGLSQSELQETISKNLNEQRQRERGSQSEKPLLGEWLWV